MSASTAAVLARRAYRRQRYAAKTAQGRCPTCTNQARAPSVYCEGCRRARRPQSRAHGRDLAEARRQAPGPNQILCCGRWVPIVHIPIRVPCCGRVYFAGGSNELGY